MTGRHLWGVKHDYYCSNQNYYGEAPHFGADRFSSWATFLAGWPNFSDKDPGTLLFRWDWDRERRTLELFFVQQKVGNFLPVLISGMVADDEPSVRAFLQSRWKELSDLWAPLSTGEEEPLTDSDRSILLFLIDSIRIAPEKASQFVGVLSREGRSNTFLRIIDELAESKDVLRIATELKERLR